MVRKNEGTDSPTQFPGKSIHPHWRAERNGICGLWLAVGLCVVESLTEQRLLLGHHRLHHYILLLLHQFLRLSHGLWVLPSLYRELNWWRFPLLFSHLCERSHCEWQGRRRIRWEWRRRRPPKSVSAERKAKRVECHHIYRDSHFIKWTKFLIIPVKTRNGSSVDTKKAKIVFLIPRH